MPTKPYNPYAPDHWFVGWSFRVPHANTKTYALEPVGGAKAGMYGDTLGSFGCGKTAASFSYLGQVGLRTTGNVALRYTYRPGVLPHVGPSRRRSARKGLRAIHTALTHAPTECADGSSHDPEAAKTSLSKWRDLSSLDEDARRNLVRSPEEYEAAQLFTHRDIRGSQIWWLDDDATRLPMLTLDASDWAVDAANTNTQWGPHAVPEPTSDIYLTGLRAASVMSDPVEHTSEAEDSTDGIPTTAWVSMVPLWTDVESAVPGDLILDSTDTTTGVTWRAAFRHQTTLPVSFLTEQLGDLTATGVELLFAALHGSIPPARTGSALESALDPRLDADLWIAEIIVRALARAAFSEEFADDPWFEEDETPTGATHPFATGRLHRGELSASQGPNSPPETLPHPGGIVLKFTLKTQDAATAPARFAAASGLTSRKTHWLTAADDANRKVRARLWLDALSDELLIELTEVNVDRSEATFVVTAEHLAEPLVVPVTLALGEDIVLSRDRGISELDITSVELHLL